MAKAYYIRLFKSIGLGLLFWSITFSNSGFAVQQMKQKDILILIKQARDAWIARDADALAQLFTSDGEIILPGQRWQGQATIRQQVAHFAQSYSDVKIEIRRTIVEGNQALIEWHYQDTEKATGLRNQADDAIVVDFKDGRISRWREYFDNQTLPSGIPPQ